MPKRSTAGTAVLACLIMGAAVTGCTGSGTSEEPSADQLLDDANEAMSGLKSVTIDTVIQMTGGDDWSGHLVTDLKGTCAYTTAAATGGARLEQLRIGGTDYVRPNRAYLKASGLKMTSTDEQKRWIKTPAAESKPGDGLSRCTHEFTSFGEATKGEASEIDGTPAVALKVADEKSEGGSYVFHVATEGKPYILEVVYKDAEFDSVTSFSAFDEPLDVRPPDESEVVDTGGTG
ncbi:hypothetical protein [Streptomyces sp. NPDC006270]|uniref:hypothetical protein n=1 Tax=Streptomyces sp. NPDC006270 TaxID=3364741 RepID=UPI00369AE29E